jgi:hypothetical protein
MPTIDPLHRTSNASLTLAQLQGNVQDTEGFGMILTDVVSVTYNGVNFNALTFDWKMPNPGPYTTFTAAPTAAAGGATAAGGAAPTFSITRQLWVANVLTSVVVARP